jgi:hypothetical protein
MTDGVPIDQTSHVAIPRKNETDDRVPPWLLVLLFLVICIPIFISVFFSYRAPQKQQPPTNIAPLITPTPDPVSQGFSGDEFIRGWYWGNKEKFPSTPDHWIYTEVDGKDCWHSPKTICR